MDEQNPYAAPQAEEPPTDYAIEGDASIVRAGKKLLVPEGALLPKRCVSCNRPATIGYSVRAARKKDREVTLPVFLIVVTLAVGFFIAMSSILVNLFFVNLLLILSIVSIVIAVRHRNSTRVQFYICPAHQFARLALTYIWIVPYAFLLLQDALQHWFGVELDWDPYPFFPLLIFLLIGMLWLANRIFSIPNVSAKYVGDIVECGGFGKRFLESFPLSDRREDVGGQELAAG